MRASPAGSSHNLWTGDWRQVTEAPFAYQKKAKLDIADIRAAGNSEPASGAAIMAHEIAEQRYMQQFGSEYPAAHAVELMAQMRVSGFNIVPHSRKNGLTTGLNGPTSATHSRGWQTVQVTFHWKNGNLVKVVRQ